MSQLFFFSLLRFDYVILYKNTTIIILEFSLIKHCYNVVL